MKSKGFLTGSSRIREGGHSGDFDDSWFRNSAAASRLATVALRAPEHSPRNACGRRLSCPRKLMPLATGVYASGTRRFEPCAATWRAFGRCVWSMRMDHEITTCASIELDRICRPPGPHLLDDLLTKASSAEFAACVLEHCCCAGVVRVWRPSPTCRERARKTSW
jgi:hypothetical protein